MRYELLFWREQFEKKNFLKNGSCFFEQKKTTRKGPLLKVKSNEKFEKTKFFDLKHLLR